ncbi:MAG TPA: histidine kinase [Gallionella sp.]|nr:histidine kinase [Gallionella sp.]
MFKLLRFYSISSFIIIFIAAGLTTLLYRQVAIQWIDDVADRDHLVLTQAALNSVRPLVMPHLDSDADPIPPSLGAELASALANLTHHGAATVVSIHDLRGVTIFSTQSGTVGTNAGSNPGFAAALNGNASSNMKYLDIFNRFFKKVSADDNRMRTFVPIRRTLTGPIVGVFEMRTDMSSLVHENERMFFIILFGSEFIFALLYGVLLLVVKRARNIIDVQQKDIQERTATLEVLSRQLLDSDELHKKRIAFDLHEGLAQTLAAIKLNAENNSRNFGISNVSLEAIVPVLQDAIHEVRNIATELRPPSLDDFGLLTTINGFCREFERMNPDIRVEQEHSTEGKKVPEPLKIVIYRIIKATFNNIALGANTDRIRVALQMTDDMITLTISDIPTESYSASNVVRHEFNPKQRFAEMHDRTIISRGVFTAKHGKSSGVTLRSSWAY